MNIWDSVHRGLEKASQEAGRIAKAQKLRSQIDSLARQINTQNNTLLSRTLELFNNNQLVQSQLLPICQELVNLQQQLEMAQTELKQVQSQQAAQAPGQANAPGSYPVASPYAGGEVSPTAYTLQSPEIDYHAQITQVPPPPPGSGSETMSAMETLLLGGTPTPPPPPGSGPKTVSGIETLLMGVTPTPPPPPAIPISMRCSNCQKEVASGLNYCPNCGKPVQESTIAHLPTMRGGTLEPFYPIGQETVRAETEAGQSASKSSEQETVRGEAPPSEK